MIDCCSSTIKLRNVHLHTRICAKMQAVMQAFRPPLRHALKAQRPPWRRSLDLKLALKRFFTEIRVCGCIFLYFTVHSSSTSIHYWVSYVFFYFEYRLHPIKLHWSTQTHWTHAVKPLIMCAYLMSTRSSQPHRRFLPVVTPTSFPRVWSSSPVSWRVTGTFIDLNKGILLQVVIGGSVVKRPLGGAVYKQSSCSAVYST